MNSIIAETQWSNTETYVIQKIELIEPPLGDFQSTVLPWFNANGIINIAHYELLIGDENDVDVEIAEVYNREHEITELEWQYPAQGIENGLFPGTDYCSTVDGLESILQALRDVWVRKRRSILSILPEIKQSSGTENILRRLGFVSVATESSWATGASQTGRTRMKQVEVLEVWPATLSTVYWNSSRPS